MKTKVINEFKKGKYYYYELEQTIFFVEGGGQMKDEGTMNGISVLSCFEENGHVYHQLEKQLDSTDVEVIIDENHRYISKQGHTAQHLLSAAIYELYQIPTVSHHYNLEGSYIDIDTDDLDDEQLKNAENWVNEKIREHREIEILYPTKEEFDNMPIHHELKVESDIRIVHIQGVEYNPCKGMHVNNTSEVQMVVVNGKEKIKGVTRIHYMFGEVARNYFHSYYEELKTIGVEVSKPMIACSDGVIKLKESKSNLEKQLSSLQQKYIDLYVQQFQNQKLVIHECDLENDLINKLCLKLSEIEGLQCYLFTDKQIIVVCGNNSKQNAKELFDELKKNFNIKGGGNPKICRGSSEVLKEIKDFIQTLNNV